MQNTNNIQVYCGFDFCNLNFMIQYLTSHWLQFVQLATSIFLIITVLLQQRGAGLGGAFGQDMASYSTKRGVEKILFKATIVLSILFFASAFAQIILR